MARTVRRMKMEQKAAQLGMDFHDDISDEQLLAAIRKTNKDFLVADDKRTSDEKARSLVRVSLTCHNPDRRERGSEQIFLTVDGQIMGQTMFYDQMEDAWHFSESFLDALLGMVHPATRAVKSKTTAGAVSADTEGKHHVTGMKYDFSARMLPPLTEKQLGKIRARQLASEGLTEEEPMVI